MPRAFQHGTGRTGWAVNAGGGHGGRRQGFGGARGADNRRSFAFAFTSAPSLTCPISCDNGRTGVVTERDVSLGMFRGIYGQGCGSKELPVER